MKHGDRIFMFWAKTPSPGNLGDVLGPIILGQLGVLCHWVRKENGGKWISIGSIARFAMPGDTVWGSGIMRKSDEVSQKANWLAVRGPITGKKCGCKCYGDPALLVSRYFPKADPSTDYGRIVVPHYRDIDCVPYDVPFVPPITSDPVSTSIKIGSADRVASSSLHGIIVAHAYGVPAGWWRPTDRLNGDGTKFADYAAGVGITLTPSRTLDGVRYCVPSESAIRAAQERLLNALL
jgi:pyruvyltransferase